MIRETDKTAGVVVTWSPVNENPSLPSPSLRKSGDEGGGPELNHRIVNYHKVILTKTETKSTGTSTTAEIIDEVTNPSRAVPNSR